MKYLGPALIVFLWIVSIVATFLVTSLSTTEYVAPLSRSDALRLLAAGHSPRLKPIAIKSFDSETLKIARKPQSHSAEISCVYTVNGLRMTRGMIFEFKPYLVDGGDF
jgi:hypothetical protein